MLLASKAPLVASLNGNLMGLGLVQGKRVVVSGAGNVSTFAIKKLLELGAIPLTASDSTGYIYEKDGFTAEKLEHLIDVKTTRRLSLKEYKGGVCLFVPSFLAL